MVGPVRVLFACRRRRNHSGSGSPSEDDVNVYSRVTSASLLDRDEKVRVGNHGRVVGVYFLASSEGVHDPFGA
jgi:hypothetical protein